MAYIPYWHDNFKALRLRKGLTQTQMGELLGVSQSLINLLESGKRHFTEKMLVNIADKCDVNVESITTIQASAKNNS